MRSHEEDKLRTTLTPDHGHSTGQAGSGARSSNSSASTPVMKNANSHSYVNPSANTEVKNSPAECNFKTVQRSLKVEEEEQEGWVCDICKTAEFSTFEEAIEHEKQCKRPAKKRKGNSRSPSKKLNMRRKKQADQFEDKPIPASTLQPRHQLMIQHQQPQQGMGHGHATQIQAQPQWQQTPQQQQQQQQPQQQAQLQQPQQVYQDTKGNQVAYYTVPSGNYVYQTAPAQAEYARGSKPSDQNVDKSQQYQVANTMANMSTITSAKLASRPNEVNLSSVMDVFIPGSMGWSCKHCISVPLRFRAPGAVSYTQERPSSDFIEQHLSVCNGGRFYEAASQQQPRQFVRTQPMIQTQQMPMVQHSMMQQQQQVPHHMFVPRQQQQQVQMVRRPIVYQQEEHYGTVATAPAYAFSQAQQQQQAQVKVEQQQSKLPSSKQAKAKSAATSPGLVTPDVYTIPADIHTITEPNSPLLPEDKKLITDYFFYLMRQLQICFFAEDDRKARKRENVTLGFAGLQCRHCAGKASARKFFWSNVDRLANSFAEIPSHIMKCRKCPHDVKAALATLKLSHPTQMARLTRGSQKVFLRQMWNRMHGKTDKAIDTPPPPPQSSPPSTPKPQDQERMALSIAEDKDWLPEEEQIVRSCIEIFEVTEGGTDKSAEGAHKVPVLGQVALRCIYCAKAGKDTDVLYPQSIGDIFSLVQEFKEFHLVQCSCCLSLLRSKFKAHKDEPADTKTSEANERYYQLAAKLLGLVDDSSSKVVKFSASAPSRETAKSSAGNVPLDLLASVTCDSSTSEKISSNSTMEPMPRKDDMKAPKFPHLNDDE